MYAPAYDTLYTTADILSKNHEDLEKSTKWLLLGIGIGVMIIAGEALGPVAGWLSVASGLARTAEVIELAFGGRRIGESVSRHIRRHAYHEKLEERDRCHV